MEILSQIGDSALSGLSHIGALTSLTARAAYFTFGGSIFEESLFVSSGQLSGSVLTTRGV